ncbi:hypothetical protein [Bizionia myxarmorum]|uniref:Uncharacterized protein n=1 Tax=Bizionia myxarmorum TaxID=291186 RepID=A0A5D0RE77_9FLAO|nr:hypothetical protein [Bizionia myxarmorum]TYB78854.1 hypothetical protein ES674_03510 [Bizionia myxarmorum]
MKNIRKNIVVILVCSGIVFSCANTKNDDNPSKTDISICENAIEGKLLNMTGLDGCGWMIELEDGNKLEPINLNSFNISMVEGKKVNLNYTEVNDRAGICMAGKIVELTCLLESLDK